MRSQILFLCAASSLAFTASVAAPPKKDVAKQTAVVGKAAVGPVASQPTSQAADKPQIGTFGFDEAGMDRTIRPGADFYGFANGAWNQHTDIPADRSSFGMFHVLDDLSQARTKTILEEAAKTPGSKIGDFYASFLDEGAADAKGLTPIRPWLDEIAAANTPAALAAEIAKLQRVGVRVPFRAGVDQDDKAPDTYITAFRQSGLGLPDRDYYLKDDPKLAEVRAAYVPYLTTLLTLAGETNAPARAAAVMAFETKLAQVQWTRADSRDADKTYNKWTPADFAAKAPGFAWNAYFPTLGIDRQAAFLVAQPSSFAGMAKVIADSPAAVVKDYLRIRLLNSYSPFLSKPIVDASFAFNGTVLSGTPENQARWKRGVDLVSDAMGEAIGQEYVAHYFPPESKAAADALVHNLIASLDSRIQRLAWMAPETKVKARAKLAAFTPKIGYPDKWRDYSTLTIARDDLVGNVARANAFEFQRGLNKLGQPIDRGEWGMTPMEINAYANPVMNEIVFPAAILQPPFFDPKADPAVNYGGIGAVIGHEISHHFDDQGRKYDATGKLTDWWTPQDVARFKALTDKVVAQYDVYEPLPGLHVNGGNTLGENMADLNGLNIAYEAYHISLHGKPAPVIDGLTGDQRFFLGWAQVWRSKYREQALRQQVISNEHSPGAQRTSVVRNLDAWYTAFGAKPGEALYLAPADRIHVW